MTDQAKKVQMLVCADVEGNLSMVYKKVSKILKSNGEFEGLLCVGDFFGKDSTEWEQYKSGKLKAPISTLILGPCKPDLSVYFASGEGDLCENITYLGSHGRYTTSTGVQIAYLSGVESEGERGLSTFGSKEVVDLLRPVVGNREYKGVDIFLTSQWPRGVDKHGSELELDIRTDSALIAEAARVLQPRYHFAGIEGVHYERQPYRNHQIYQEEAKLTTRFVALAKLANKDKKKSMYAMQLEPLSKMARKDLITQPPDTTECPYTPVEIAGLKPKDEGEGEQFFYDMSSRGGRGGRDGRKRRGHDRGAHRGGKERKGPRSDFNSTSNCWFCLGSPDAEKHLVVSVATETYLALAKGGLVPDHILILPICHHQSLVTVPETVEKEIKQYKSSLKKCYKADGKAVVFFERNYKTSHLQIQVVPVPQASVQDIKDTYMECAESSGIELNEIPKFSDLKEIIEPEKPYFYVELPTGERLLHRIQQKFPLQFGREALSEPPILNMPERVDWKNCKLSQEEETEHAQDFKARFKAFDFSLE